MQVLCIIYEFTYAERAVSGASPAVRSREHPDEVRARAASGSQQIIALHIFLHKSPKYAVNNNNSAANLQQRVKKHIISKNSLCMLLI